MKCENVQAARWYIGEQVPEIRLLVRGDTEVDDLVSKIGIYFLCLEGAQLERASHEEMIPASERASARSPIEM
jgi:hypothetical protein